MIQQRVAGRIGIKSPETIFTNSPSEIRAFLKRRGKIVYKPFCPAVWRSRESDWLPYTALLTEDALVSDELLRLTPGIFQELVPKAYELRVTVIGRRTFAAKVLSQSTEKGKLDWRKAYDELRFEPASLPPEVEHQCFALLDELGLVFGCFDFIVTPTGEHVFLEVNEAGQFLFIERYCGLPLLDAFTEFLFQGNVEFEWSEEAITTRYTDPEFEQAVTARAREFRASHVVAPEALIDEEEQPQRRRPRKVSRRAKRAANQEGQK
jgi:glutathione synthase/RimK-type ligase-like ATP-grasp enzyme